MTTMPRLPGAFEVVEPPDYQTCMEMLRLANRTLRIHASP